MFPRRYHAPRLVTEAPEDPLLSFSVLNAFIATNVVAFNGDAALALAMQFLTLAEKKGTTTHLMLAHRGMGVCSLHRGDIATARRHLEQTIALYDRTEHGQLATRFSEDPRSMPWATDRSRIGISAIPGPR